MIDPILESMLKKRYQKYLGFCIGLFLLIIVFLIAGFLLNSFWISIVEIILIIITAYFLIKVFGKMKNYHEKLLDFYDEAIKFSKK